MLRLPIIFKEELKPIVTWCENDIEFSPVITKYNKDKQWSAISLRGYGKDIYQIGKGGVLGTGEVDELQDTSLFRELKIHRILEKIPAETERVRLMKLKAGTKISKHNDRVDKDIKSGKIIRLHIPVITHKKILMKSWLKNLTVETNFKRGECWWLDVSRAHEVNNNSDVDRVHLVIDIFNNDTIREYFNRPNLDDFESVWEIFKQNKEWFPHVRSYHIRHRLMWGQVYFKNNVVITYQRYKRDNKLGSAVAKEGDTILHQIVAKERDGSAQKTIKEFFEFVNGNVWLTVRENNNRANAFYKKIGMEQVGKISWVQGKMPGLVWKYSKKGLTSLTN